MKEITNYLKSDIDTYRRNARYLDYRFYASNACLPNDFLFVQTFRVDMYRVIY